MAQIPKAREVKDPYKPICRDCAMYFSIAVVAFFGMGWLVGCLVVKCFYVNVTMSIHFVCGSHHQ